MIVVARPEITLHALSEELRQVPRADAVAEFENGLRELTGVTAVRAVASGRTAIFLALQALGIDRGHEVVIPSFICPVVVDAVIASGARPVLVDNETDTPGLSPDYLQSVLNERTRAVIVAHVYGVPARIAEIREITERHGITLIEDCAHALGVRAGGSTCGTIGDVAIFSFNFDKPVTTGYGGAIAVRDEQLLRRADALLDASEPAAEEELGHLFGLLVDLALTDRDTYREGLPYGISRAWLKVPGVLREFGEWRKGGAVHVSSLRAAALAAAELARNRERRFLRRLGRRLLGRKHEAPFRVARMGAARASAGVHALRRYAAEQECRSHRAEALRQRVSGAFRPIDVPATDQARWIRYAVVADRPAAAVRLSRDAAAAGVQAGPLNWPAPIHRIARYRNVIRADRGSLQRSESFAARVVNLPVHAQVREEDLVTLGELMQAVH